MSITSAELADRIDPHLAVDRALTAGARVAFLSRLNGTWAGAQPADYLDQAEQADAHLDIVEPWCERHLSAVADGLPAQLPARLRQRLVVSALYATITLGWLRRPGDKKKPVAKLAHRAAMWACGYAEAIGWAGEAR